VCVRGGGHLSCSIHELSEKPVFCNPQIFAT
jgi:hypothetical protein